jgi:predicted transcriptional regulator
MPPRRPRLARISITLPRAVLAAADRLAARLDRSRSWVIAEAVRRFGETEQTATPQAVHEPAVYTYAMQEGAREVAEARRRHLRAELQLQPAERLRRAEELVELARAAHPRPRRPQVIGFDSYEDYYEWKKWTRLRE